MIVFSATIPAWLKKSVSRYMNRENFAFHNLIGDSKEKTAVNVEHFALKCPRNSVRKEEVILNLFERYARDLQQSQLIIFCQTKHECDQLAQSNQINSYPTAVLHGNLSQFKREQVLQVSLSLLFLSLLSFISSVELSSRNRSFPDHYGYLCARFGHSSSRSGHSHFSTTGQSLFSLLSRQG